MIHRYEDGEAVNFKIDYQKEIVKFINGTICDKKMMFLSEFATSVLEIQAEEKELVAAYIGKETIDSYKKGNKQYILKRINVKKNFFEGSIQKIEA